MSIRTTFDKITSNNSESWSLALFWIVIFEILATMIEYSFVHQTPDIMMHIPDGIYSEIIIGLIVTVYIWLCMYNLVFWDKTSILYLILFGFIGVYLITTHDFVFDLFIKNINIFRLIQSDTGINLIIQLFFKIIIFYLIYQLIKSLRTTKTL
ncbi:conserved hypothetical protein [Arcobacter nitrofigilis DSM 7299]|uniref:Uncharacterized protein n=1 Tax=Arcobacter nitrofigilis (strain ATCC 33309 / DSM 7299 / CCUG 15893 / LMG 7604 / NCTC 12251 / CI) TaxID=572480 RepID=D5V287_ARCNC|nr:hypothetical protein [Arcobacter nitrofigilis]ADG92320.1 conserved hypothetical protein [Arcobacter nitrofigilis DSM 7299]